MYQCRKALRRNMAVNCSLTRLNISWMAVVLPMKVALIFRPLGGMSQICAASSSHQQKLRSRICRNQVMEEDVFRSIRPNNAQRI